MECGGGYEYQFVKPPLDWLVCNICHYPSKEPYLTDCCGNTFCKSCLECAKKATTINDACPICRKEEFGTFAHKQADRAIRSLHVFCNNKEKGCEWQGEVNDILNHLAKSAGCQFEEVVCPNDCEKCLQRQYLTSHVEDECVRRKVDCHYCQITGEHQFIEGEHKKLCPKLPIICPNKCEANNILREDIDEHRKMCTLEEVTCPNNCGETIQRQHLATHVCQCFKSNSRYGDIATVQQFTELQTQLLKSKEELSEKIEGDVMAIRKQLQDLRQLTISSDVYQLPVTAKKQKGILKWLLFWCFIPALVICIGLFIQFGNRKVRELHNYTLEPLEKNFLSTQEEQVTPSGNTEEALAKLETKSRMKITTELEMKLEQQTQQIRQIMLDSKIFWNTYMKCRRLNSNNEYSHISTEQRFTKLQAHLMILKEQLTNKIEDDVINIKEQFQVLKQSQYSSEAHQLPTDQNEQNGIFKQQHLWWCFILILIVYVGVLISFHKRITELENKLDWHNIINTTASKLPSGGQDVPVIVKMSEYTKKKKEKISWYSDTFFTHHKGYKMCLNVYAAGFSSGTDTHLSVWLHLMKGPYDDDLKWPLKGHCEVKLLNQSSDNEHHSRKGKYEYSGHQRVTNGYMVTSGERNGWSVWYSHQFISNEDLYKITPTHRYLKDDSIFLQVDYILD